MKIIHMADAHLDSKLNANLDGDKRKVRKQELLISYEKMVDYAVSNNVSAIIIAGDLFDTNTVSKTACNVVAKSIVDHPEIEFYYLKGNHDADTFVSSLEDVPDNLHLFSNEWKDYSLDNDGKVILYGIELDKDNSNSIYDSLNPDARCINIVTLHGQISNYSAKDKAEVISLNSLKNKNIDYVALGHVHSYLYEALDDRGHVCYPGCLEPRGFDECGESHGFCVLDIDVENHLVEHSFVKHSMRNSYIVDCDISDCDDSVAVVNKIKSIVQRDSIGEKNLVKISLSGERDAEEEMNLDFILESFKRNFFFVKIEDNTKIRVDIEKYAKDVSLKGEFIRSVMADNTMDDDSKGEVIRMGLLALAGEEY